VILDWLFGIALVVGIAAVPIAVAYWAVVMVAEFISWVRS
jgi:hypothetical protein